MKCNKCVHNFDHHCKWVNNCIGEKNYKVFFIFLISVLFCTSTKQITDILVCWNILKDQLKSKNPKYYTFCFSLGLVEVIQDTILQVGIIELLGFHIYLKIKNLSTFEYILNQREKKLFAEDKNKTFELVGSNVSLKTDHENTSIDKKTVNFEENIENKKLSNSPLPNKKVIF